MKIASDYTKWWALLKFEFHINPSLVLEEKKKSPSSQSYGFSCSYVWMWELDYKESWALKNWCFWTMVLEKTLESPLDCKKFNQSILKEISHGCSLDGLMLKLKLEYFAAWCEDLTHLKRPWCWERLRAGGEGDGRGWDGWMASPTQWTWVWTRFGRWWRTGKPASCSLWGRKELDTTEQLIWTMRYTRHITNT